MALVIKTTGLEQYAPGGEARVKVLLIGGPGVGKTRWSSYFPKPFYADCESGLASVADRRAAYVSINTSQDMADFLHHVKMDNRLPKDKRTIETVVIDTFDAYQRKLKNEWMETNRKDAFTGWEAWGWLGQKMTLLLTKLLNLDVNIVVSVHYKDKTIKDDESGRETHELMLQLSGEIADTAYNDFDLVGFMGTYWAAVDGERVQKRGITFKPSPDKPFLKDRLHVTPPWLEVTFAPSDYENLFAAIAARAGELAPSETIGQVESETPEVPATVATPAAVPSGAIAQDKPVELPLIQLDKPTLLKKARELGITQLNDGSPIKGNTLKSELVAAIEAHLAKAAEPVEAGLAAVFNHNEVATPVDERPLAEQAAEAAADMQKRIAAARANIPTQASPPAIESVAEGVVDTTTGELLNEAAPLGEAAGDIADYQEPQSDGPPAVLEAVAPQEPTHTEAVATVADKLGGQVISDVEDTAAAAALARAKQAQAPAATPSKDSPGVCSECGKDLAGEDQNYVKLSRIKYRALLCQDDYIKRKSA